MKRAEQWRRRERGRTGRGSATSPPGAEQRTISDNQLNSYGEEDREKQIGDLQYLGSATFSPGAEQRTIGLHFTPYIYLPIISYLYVQGAGQIEGKTAPHFISQIYKCSR